MFSEKKSSNPIIFAKAIPREQNKTGSIQPKLTSRGTKNWLIKPTRCKSDYPEEYKEEKASQSEANQEKEVSDIIDLLVWH